MKEKNNIGLRKDSSQETKRASADAMFSAMSELLFERINLINGTFIVSQNTTLTNAYTVNVRVLDSSRRMFMRPDRQARMRCSLYMGGAGAQFADFYVMVPALLTDTTKITFSDPHRLITSVQDFDAFVGIRFKSGVASLESWDGKTLVSKPLSFYLSGDSTVYLEIHYNISNAEFYINNVNVGSIQSNLQLSSYTYNNFYPLIAPTKSTDGSAVNLNFESYQILQDK